jgi:hypothetical protein
VMITTSIRYWALPPYMDMGKYACGLCGASATRTGCHRFMLGGAGGNLPFAEYAFALDVIAAIAAVRSGTPLVAEGGSVAGTPTLLSDASGDATLCRLTVRMVTAPQGFGDSALKNHVRGLARTPKEELRKLRLSDDGKLRILSPRVALPVLVNEEVGG